MSTPKGWAEDIATLYGLLLLFSCQDVSLGLLPGIEAGNCRKPGVLAPPMLNCGAKRRTVHASFATIYLKVLDVLFRVLLSCAFNASLLLLLLLQHHSTLLHNVFCCLHSNVARVYILEPRWHLLRHGLFLGCLILLAR